MNEMWSCHQRGHCPGEKPEHNHGRTTVGGILLGLQGKEDKVRLGDSSKPLPRSCADTTGEEQSFTGLLEVLVGEQGWTSQEAEPMCCPGGRAGIFC